MFSFFRRRPQVDPITDYGFLGVDFHSHLIPGIDDGVPDLETSLACLEKMEAMGYKKVIASPHVSQDYWPNTSSAIRAGLAEVQAAARERGLGLQIEAAAEYLLDDVFLKKMKTGDVLTFAGNYLLFEIPFAVPPTNLDGIVFMMMTEGYQPILAHPERYAYLQDHPERLQQLKEKGCLFQLNLLSLSGRYGSRVKEHALTLLKNDWIDFVCTDAHKLRDIEKMSELLESRDLNPLAGKTFRNLELLG